MHRFETLIAMLRHRADVQGDVEAFVFLADGEREEARLTFGELEVKARAIAARLGSSDIRGERVLLLYPPGLDFVAAFFGSLFAGAIPVPVYPPDPSRLTETLPKLDAIAHDAGVVRILATGMVTSFAQALPRAATRLGEVDWLETPEIPASAAERWRDPGASGVDLAFLQYTSGSTGEPKGVMLSHENILHNLGLIYDRFGHSTESRGVIWLPPYHDMGLIGGILQPVFGGFPVVLMSPSSFLQRPARWLRAISKYHATTSGGPNFAYDLCVRKVGEEDRASITLDSWEVAFNGAEPIKRETLDRFVSSFAPCGFRREAFYPCYGLAEATLMVTGAAKDEAPVLGFYSAPALRKNLIAPARVKLVIGAKFLRAGEWRAGRTSDISASGVCIRAEDLLEVGEITTIRFDGGPFPEGYEVRGEIVRWVAGDDSWRGMEIRFLFSGSEMRRSFRRDLERFLSSQDLSNDTHVRALVGCGTAEIHEHLQIVDPVSRCELWSNQIGEVWFQSPSVACGYWGWGDASESAFRAQPPQSQGESFLRTGDLGFISDGQLFLVGRIKDLIVVRGKNYHPQDIEQTVEAACPGLFRLGCSAAFAVERSAGEGLIVVQEVARHDGRGRDIPQSGVDVDEVYAAVRSAVVAAHGIDLDELVLVATGSIPKTSSGKVRRHACRAAYLESTLPVIAAKGAKHATDRDHPAAEDQPLRLELASRLPRTKTRASVGDWLVGVLSARLSVPTAELDVQRPLSRYGLDSLAAAELQDVLQKELGVVVAVHSELLDMSVDGILGRAFPADAPEIDDAVVASNAEDASLAEEARRLKADARNFDFSSFYAGMSEDTFGILDPFQHWWRDAKPAGYYLFGLPLQSAPATLVDIHDTHAGITRRQLINFASYNYLGLSYHPEVIEAAIAAVRRYGLGAAGSPILSGTFGLHEELASRLASFKRQEAALLYPSGYSANVGVIAGLMRAGDSVIADQWVHASIVDGIVLSKVNVRFFRHNSLEDLERKLSNAPGKKLVVVEGVYSMEGDIVDLPGLVEICRKYGARVMVDEAHSDFLLGGDGRGVCDYFNLGDDAVDIHFGTLSKSLGGIGGFVAGPRKLIDYLRGFSRSHVFSCALPPGIVAGVMKALEIAIREPQRRERVRENSLHMRALLRARGLDAGKSESQVIPVMIGDDDLMFELAEAMLHRGVFVQPVRYPAVGKGCARFRLVVTAEHKTEQLATGADVIHQVFQTRGVGNTRGNGCG